MKTQREKLAQFDGLEKAYDVLTCALSDFVKGKVERIGKAEGLTLYITRPSSASGGIVILNHGGTVCAYYFEEALRDQMRRFDLCLTSENNELNRALLAHRELWEKARAYVNANR